MKKDSVFDKALKRVKVNKDGISWDYEAIVSEVAKELPDDPDYKDKRARSIVDGFTKAGRTAPEGQLMLPGFDPFPYEPNRLIKDETLKNVAPEKRSNPEYRRARLNRMHKNIARAQARARREASVLPEFMEWQSQRILAGEDIKDLVWDRYIKESGLWAVGKVVADPLAGDDEE
jgi:hypothetical protein